MSSALAQMDLQPLCISGTNVLLLELPYYRRFRLKDVETIINRNDIQVVFAHIERFSRLWNKETFAAVMELPSTNKLTVALFVMLAGDSGGSCSAGFQTEKCTCWVQTHITSPVAL